MGYIAIYLCYYILFEIICYNIELYLNIVVDNEFEKNSKINI